MITPFRKSFNAAFSEEKYQKLQDELGTELGFPIKFRVAETPVFVPKELGKKIMEACDEIVNFVMRSDLKTLTEPAIDPKWCVPNEDDHTLFLCVDFAICQDATGELTPQLIEFQGFPSLFSYKPFLAKKFRELYPIPEEYSIFFNGLDTEAYYKKLGKALLGGYLAENVILLEIEPMLQNTGIDFVATEKMFGIKSVCISEIEKEGKKLYYQRDGVRTPIHRIYNRIIFDELEQRPDLIRSFNMTDEVEVEWAGHPNWFARISKFCMPFLKSKYVPSCTLLSDFDVFPTNLEEYVLKPLYSFSGAGVKFHVTKEDLEAIPTQDYPVWMLQKKVIYTPIIEAADGGLVKTEIRILFIWDKDDARPMPVLNIARLSRGEMIGVKFNKNKTFVGGSICFFEPF